MKKFFISAIAGALLGLYPTNDLLAQTKVEKEKSKNKISEHDEIIIKQKDADKEGKVVVEIKDGAVTVNGKPIDEYDDDNISVRRRSATRFSLTTAASPFRNGGVWTTDSEDRAFLGVTTEDTDEGARILTVSENSAAAKAGLKKGDVILKVNDATIGSPDDLSKAVVKHKPEDKVTVTYKREGKENNTTATLGKRETMAFGNGNVIMPTMPSMENFHFDFDDDRVGSRTIYANPRPRIGIRAQDTEESTGAKVLGVDKGSIAEKAGIKENDIITEFDGKNVKGADDLVMASRAAKDKTTMNVKINRDGKSQAIELKVPKKLKTANL